MTTSARKKRQTILSRLQYHEDSKNKDPILCPIIPESSQSNTDVDAEPSLNTNHGRHSTPHACFTCAWRKTLGSYKSAAPKNEDKSIQWLHTPVTHTPRPVFVSPFGRVNSKVTPVLLAAIVVAVAAVPETTLTGKAVAISVTAAIGVICLGSLVTGFLFNKTKPVDDRILQKNCKVLKEKMKVEDIREEVRSKKEDYAQIMSQAIKIATVSQDEGSEDGLVTDYSTFLKLHSLLKDSFPLLHSQYPPKVINKHSLLFEIPGSDADLLPVMFCAHLDVVPADTGDWEKDPFGGEIDEKGVIWGRGAIDNKHNLISQLGAMEYLLTKNQLPKRGITIACGHDEEIGGYNGARHIAQHLKNKKFHAIFDEGTMMVSKLLPGLDTAVAMVGVAEKGSLSLELSINGPGGHSSMPPVGEEGLISIMGNAVRRLEENPLPAHFGKDSLFRGLLESVAHRCSFATKFICQNLWIFGGMMKKALLAAPGSAAMIRTTMAVTKIKGGNKINSIPQSVSAYVNHRVHPKDTIESVIEHDRRVINDDRITIKVYDEKTTTPPSPLTSIKSQPYHWVQKAITMVYNFPITPQIFVGNSDTRWYWDLSPNIIRFSPIELTTEQAKMLHGVNERISMDALAEMVVYYLVLMKLSEDSG